MLRAWDQVWADFELATGFSQRASQMELGAAISENTRNGGQLIAQAGTGVGKSFAYLLPAIEAAKAGQRTAVSTETLTLMDQLVDKDLKFLYDNLGGFTWFGLKGRNHYICFNKTGGSHPIAQRLRSRELGNGERRDVERVLGFELSDDDWQGMCSDRDFCGMTQCAVSACYSSRARQMAERADIVVTSHAMLRIHGETDGGSNGAGDGVLGNIRHLVVDEAHTLEQTLVDGGTLSLRPWELSKKLESIAKALEGSAQLGTLEQADRRLLTSLNSVRDFMQKMTRPKDDKDWTRQSMKIGQFFMSSGSDPDLLYLLDAYENGAQKNLAKASKEYERINKALLSAVELATSGKRKLKSGAAASGFMASLTGLMSQAMNERTGVVETWGSTYVMLADGASTRTGRSVGLRAVPLDISGFARSCLWTVESVTILSATLADPGGDGFRYAKRSLGLSKDCKELMVTTPFDYANQQIVYVTKTPTDAALEGPSGVKYQLSELRELIRASSGRALVLYTSRAELDYAAKELRASPIGWKLLVQEDGVRKHDLTSAFKSDPSSVLLGSRSFFTGVDFQGEACSLVAICKWPNLRWDDLTKAQMAYWRERGFPHWYESASLMAFAQAAGRLIRSTSDRGVVAVLDTRVSENGRMRQSLDTALSSLYPGCRITSSASDVQEFLQS